MTVQQFKGSRVGRGEGRGLTHRPGDLALWVSLDSTLEELTGQLYGAVPLL